MNFLFLFLGQGKIEMFDAEEQEPKDDAGYNRSTGSLFTQKPWSRKDM